MFVKLRNKFIGSIVGISTVIILVAFTVIFGIMSASMSIDAHLPREVVGTSWEEVFRKEIQKERSSSLGKLAFLLVSVGVSLDVIIFFISCFLAEDAIRPVKDTYDKQREFIASASHELKTPIAAIQANFEALGVEEAPWTENIETELDKANHLVRDMLTLAKSESGTLERSEPRRCDLSELVRKSAQVVEARLDQRKLELVIPDEEVATLAKEEFVQILDILLDNAVKYSQTWIKVELKSNEELVVSNDGKKIPADQINNIFERFYQADRNSHGAGLGLAIAKATADLNGWNIVVESNNKQTCFRLLFGKNAQKLYNNR